MGTHAVGPTWADVRSKRLMDVTASALGLILVAPLMAVISIAVGLSTPGPVIFRHERLGRFGRPFLMYKFRSMRWTPALSRDATEVTVSGDSRVTAVGLFLRRYKLDELPQLVNVLKGDMSLVGPRPEVERYARLYPREYRRILSVRPGITDLASLEYRFEEEILARSADPEQAYTREILPAKIHLNLRYIEERSLSTDLKLIARTLLRMVA